MHIFRNEGIQRLDRKERKSQISNLSASGGVFIHLIHYLSYVPFSRRLFFSLILYIPLKASLETLFS